MFVPHTEQQKKDMLIPKQQVHAWADSLRKLHEINDVSKERIWRAILWYQDHYSDDYVPVIESGTSFRDKFGKLEDAIARADKYVEEHPDAPPTIRNSAFYEDDGIPWPEDVDPEDDVEIDDATWDPCNPDNPDPVLN